MMENSFLFESCWAEVDLEAIRSNVRQTRLLSSSPVMAVVKANAYGHGSIAVARAALEGGADWLAVARCGEAQELRRAGLSAPILLLGYTPPLRLEEMVAERVSMAFWSIEQAKAAAAAAARVGLPARLHLKVDSGMSRLGVQAEDALALVRSIAGFQTIRLEGIFTHFARADEREPAPSDAQEACFRGVLQALDSAGLTPPLVVASNSAASLTRPSARFNLVRLGIAMYGLSPSDECPLPPAFRAALTWKTVLSQVKTLPAGRGLSYGHRYITAAEERIGTIPVGYADGFRRTTGNTVLVGGKKAPVRGRVCMDQCLVSLQEIPGARVGDEVVLIGKQMSAKLSAEEVAHTWGTINYEVTCGIGARVPRIYG